MWLIDLLSLGDARLPHKFDRLNFNVYSVIDLRMFCFVRLNMSIKYPIMFHKAKLLNLIVYHINMAASIDRVQFLAIYDFLRSERLVMCEYKRFPPNIAHIADVNKASRLNGRSLVSRTVET